MNMNKPAHLCGIYYLLLTLPTLIPLLPLPLLLLLLLLLLPHLDLNLAVLTTNHDKFARLTAGIGRAGIPPGGVPPARRLLVLGGRGRRGLGLPLGRG